MVSSEVDDPLRLFDRVGECIYVTCDRSFDSEFILNLINQMHSDVTRHFAGEKRTSREELRRTVSLLIASAGAQIAEAMRIELVELGETL